MRVAKIRINNFRSQRDTGWLRFEPVTVIAGQNDVGKSNILLALDRFFSEKVQPGDKNHHATD